LLYHLDAKSPLPLVDETGLSLPLDLELGEDLGNEKALTARLLAQGLRLTKEKRRVLQLILSDASSSSPQKKSL
jgi:hypothetical protein